jgi:hypothetical protein
MIQKEEGVAIKVGIAFFNESIIMTFVQLFLSKKWRQKYYGDYVALPCDSPYFRAYHVKVC